MAKLSSCQAKVIKFLPNFSFLVELGRGKQATAYLAGKMRRDRIKIQPGDEVTVEFSPYDFTSGRITERKK